MFDSNECDCCRSTSFHLFISRHAVTLCGACGLRDSVSLRATETDTLRSVIGSAEAFEASLQSLSVTNISQRTPPSCSSFFLFSIQFYFKPFDSISLQQNMLWRFPHVADDKCFSAAGAYANYYVFLTFFVHPQEDQSMLICT